MSNHRHRDMFKKAGFSMIEVSLALLVVSIGLMSLIALIPASLDQGKKAIDDSQMGLLGENIMNGYRAVLLLEGWDQWDSLTIPATAVDVWHEGNMQDIVLTGGSGAGTNSYAFSADLQDAGAVVIEDVSARYELNAEIHNISSNELLSITLELQAGAFGVTNATVFYTEIYNTDLSW